jgi:hypothetical protein
MSLYGKLEYWEDRYKKSIQLILEIQSNSIGTNLTKTLKSR